MSRLEVGRGVELVVVSVGRQDVSGWSAPLTAAELEVATLLLSGASNEEIARCRGRSVRTIANQIASIYAKLGVGSRAELARLAAGTGPTK